MALVVAVSSVQDIIQRWSAALKVAGHSCSILAPGLLRERKRVGAPLCLFDLGPRGGIDPLPLVEAVSVNPDTAFIAMTARPEPKEGLRLLRRGVRGYCNRLVSAQVLAALLATVESGEIWAGRQVTDYLLQSRLAEEGSPAAAGELLLDRLTAREAGIARQVAAGLSNKVIAADAGISERTVKAHLNSIFRKTGMRNRVQLALAISQRPGDSRRLSNG
jgi:DNA-binding NarL/FixJ family response regulator